MAVGLILRNAWVKRGDRVGSLPESACSLMMQITRRSMSKDAC